MSAPKHYIGFDKVDYRYKWVYFTVSAILLFYIWPIIEYVTEIDINGFKFTEYLINYEAGFVRRGLLGQLLFWIYGATGFDVTIMIRVICFCAYIFVVLFFFRKFVKEGYSWWFLFSPLVLGLFSNIIRKDFLEMGVLIGMFSLVKTQSPSILQRILATALAIVGLFLHEAFFFWGIPLFLLLLLQRGGIPNDAKNNDKWINILLVGIIIFVFLLQLIFKGNPDIAHGIVDSWNEQFSTPLLEHRHMNSIGALGWKTMGAIKFHIWNNFFGNNLLPMGLFWQPLWGIAIYYFCTNFIFVFHRPGMKDVKEKKLAFSAVYILTLICMLPLFLFLSCDWGRLYCYLSVATLAAFVNIPHNRIIGLFPKSFLRKINKINDALTKCFHPNARLLLLMLLFLSISFSCFNISENVEASIIWNVIYRIFDILMSWYHEYINLNIFGS